MKILFFSDIHGVYDNLEVLKKLDEKEHFDKIIVLGDLFYHYGKDVPDKYLILDFLNGFKDRISGTRGNCDTYDDINICKFNIEDFLKLKVDGLNILCTHGHLYDKYSDPSNSDIFIFGHEHIPYIDDSNKDKIFINTGSISLPRQNSRPSYLIYHDNKFTLYDIDGNIIDSINIDYRKR